MQAPDWFLLWTLVAGTALWARTNPPLRRAAGVLAVCLGAVFALILIGPVWDAMPRTFREVQLPHRLNTYVALLTAGLVLVCVLALERSQSVRTGRALRAGLIAASAISLALCVWQVWFANSDEPWSYHNRNQALRFTHLTPATWYDFGNYSDASQPVVRPGGRSLVINPAEVNSDHVDLVVTPPPGLDPFVTNISGGPYAVKIGGGITRVGQNGSGFTVARRTHPGTGPVSVSLGAAGGSMAVGWIVSLAAIVAALLAFAMGLSGPLDRWLRKRKRRTRRSIAPDGV